jgi:hypothetical protein
VDGMIPLTGSNCQACMGGSISHFVQVDQPQQ